MTTPVLLEGALLLAVDLAFDGVLNRLEKALRETERPVHSEREDGRTPNAQVDELLAEHRRRFDEAIDALLRETGGAEQA